VRNWAFSPITRAYARTHAVSWARSIQQLLRSAGVLTG
jgi:hypothetical protein